MDGEKASEVSRIETMYQSPRRSGNCNQFQRLKRTGKARRGVSHPLLLRCPQRMRVQSRVRKRTHQLHRHLVRMRAGFLRLMEAFWESSIFSNEHGVSKPRSMVRVFGWPNSIRTAVVSFTGVFQIMTSDILVYVRLLVYV